MENQIEQPVFQSTLPMQGVTRRDQRPKLPRLVSIHTPHAGSDSNIWHTCKDTRQI